MNRLIANSMTCTLIGLLSISTMAQNHATKPAVSPSQAVLADGTLVHDFMFADTPRMVHVLNAPSPAATVALPIAAVIAARALHEAE